MDILSQIIVDNLLSVILLVVGFVLLVIEMYVPGFGAFGISGCVLLIGGIIAARPTPLQALIMVVIILALLCIVLSVSIHSASKGRLSKSKLVLNDVSIEHAEAEDLAYFVDKKGVAVTVLRPAGMAEFDGVKLNVVSDGEFIPEGERVRVSRVEGNRIVVVKAEA